MKKALLICSVITVASFTSIQPVFANNIAQNLCNYVAADDKKRLRSYLKSNKLKIRNIFSSIQCNGQNLVAFAASKNAVNTGSLMINKLPKKMVVNLVNSISGSQLEPVAQKRLNG